VSCIHAFCFVVAFTGTFFAAPALAVEQETEPLGKETPSYATVVTANKVEQQPESITQSVRVIDAFTWEERVTVPRNLAELTQLEPGQLVNPLSRNDANWGSAAGLGPSYNSYLLDGLPIDTFVDAMSLDPWAFERLEEQRGPASVRYGNYLGMDFAGNQSALAGVTNFILKERIERAETRLLMGGGSWGTADAKAFHKATPELPLLPRRRLRAVRLHRLRHRRLLAAHPPSAGVPGRKALRKGDLVLRPPGPSNLVIRSPRRPQRQRRAPQPRLRSWLRHL
jgi:hypothetical protein